MTRRGFLAAFAAAAVLDPEKLLWRPGEKLISIPAPRPELSVLTTRPFLEVGDIVTFGLYPERYIVTEAARSMNEIDLARFQMLPFIGSSRPGPWVHFIPPRWPDKWQAVMRREPR